MMLRTAFLPPLLALCVSSQLACSTTQGKPVDTAWAAKVAADVGQAQRTAGRAVTPGAADARLAPPVTGPLYFDFDDHQLDEAAQTQLFEIAEHLQQDPQARVIIEGHCDDRGDSAYNLALGDRRAQAAKQYLLRLGVEEERVRILSFGEEMPAVAGDDEAARAKNRRDEVTYFRAENREASLDTAVAGDELLRFDVDWSR